MLKWNCKSGCCDARSQQPLLFYTKNTPRSPCGERGAKTKLVFTAARSLQSRSYAAGGARYLQADLMLLTHAGCAFKDPRGRFGISNTRLPADQCRKERGNEIRVSLAKAEALYVLLLGISALTCHSFALLRCAVTASAEQPPFGLGCRCGPFKPEFPKKDYLYSSTRRVRCS